MEQRKCCTGHIQYRTVVGEKTSCARRMEKTQVVIVREQRLGQNFGTRSPSTTSSSGVNNLAVTPFCSSFLHFRIKIINIPRIIVKLKKVEIRRGKYIWPNSLHQHTKTDAAFESLMKLNCLFDLFLLSWTKCIQKVKTRHAESGPF